VLDGDAVLAVPAQQAISQWIYRPLDTPAGQAGFISTVRMKFNLLIRKLIDTAAGGARLPAPGQPPQLVRPPEDTHAGDVVHMHVLVNDQGRVVDMKVPPADGPQFEAARDILRDGPSARALGNLPVASYVESMYLLARGRSLGLPPGSDAR